MRRFFAIVALAVLSACGNEIDQSTRPDNLVGSYHLVSYSGVLLPATLFADSLSSFKVLDGQLILAADGAWSETLSVQERAGGVTQVEAITSFGSWNNIREFAFISFYDKLNLYSFSGTASGNTVILTTVNGDQLVYRR
jgi:hypothetical protein